MACTCYAHENTATNLIGPDGPKQQAQTRHETGCSKTVLAESSHTIIVNNHIPTWPSFSLYTMHHINIVQMSSSTVHSGLKWASPQKLKNTIRQGFPKPRLSNTRGKIVKHLGMCSAGMPVAGLHVDIAIGSTYPLFVTHSTLACSTTLLLDGTSVEAEQSLSHTLCSPVRQSTHSPQGLSTTVPSIRLIITWYDCSPAHTPIKTLSAHLPHY